MTAPLCTTDRNGDCTTCGRFIGAAQRPDDCLHGRMSSDIASVIDRLFHVEPIHTLPKQGADERGTV